MATVHRKETMIALRARSKAFRVAMDFLHPQRLDFRQNVERCSCGGELRITEPAKGIWGCMECGQQSTNSRYVSEVDEPEYFVQRNSPAKRLIAWVLLTAMFLGTLAIAWMGVQVVKSPPQSPQTVNPQR